jgi:hypothetical protein
LKQVHHFSFTRKLNETILEMKSIKQKENWLEFLNPFRIIIKVIETPFQFLMFIGHLVGMGVMADGIKGIPRGMTVTFGISNETLIDTHYFMEEEHHHEHEKKEKHAHKQNKHQHHHEEEHDHHHGTLINKLLKCLLSPLYVCSALWMYAFNSETNPPSFWGQLKKAFGHEERKESNLQSPVSDQWKYQEAMLKVNKKLAKFEKAAQHENCKKLKTVKEELQAMQPMEGAAPENIFAKYQSHSSTNATSKNGFFANHTKSSTNKAEKFLDKMASEDYAISYKIVSQ